MGYWDTVVRSDDTDIRETCLICGKPLTGRQTQFCSQTCARIARSSKAVKNYQVERSLLGRIKEQRKETFEQKVQVIKIHRSMCDNCVWRSWDRHCVQPSCFRARGIGYERGDTLLAALGEDLNDSAESATAAK